MASRRGDTIQGASERSGALAMDVRELAGTAFLAPGPLFNEARHAIFEGWFENFAANLDQAASALDTGRDASEASISAGQVADGLEKMCSQYGQRLDRLEGVCGSHVRTRFSDALARARELAAGMGRQAGEPPTSGAASRSQATSGLQHQCKNCGRTHSWSSGNPQPLSQQEQLICAKENLPFAAMKRVTCPHCGVSSLAPGPHGSDALPVAASSASAVEQAPSAPASDLGPASGPAFGLGAQAPSPLDGSVVSSARAIGGKLTRKQEKVGAILALPTLAGAVALGAFLRVSLEWGWLGTIAGAFGGWIAIIMIVAWPITATMEGSAVRQLVAGSGADRAAAVKLIRFAMVEAANLKVFASELTKLVAMPASSGLPAGLNESLGAAGIVAVAQTTLPEVVQLSGDLAEKQSKLDHCRTAIEGFSSALGWTSPFVSSGKALLTYAGNILEAQQGLCDFAP